MTAQVCTDAVQDVPKRMWIAGRWSVGAGGDTFPVYNPATGQVLAEMTDGTPQDAVAALDAACAAQESWQRTSPRDRAALLHSTFELILRRMDDLARLMTLEMGKPLTESRAEVAYAAEFLRWNAEEAVRISGRCMTSPDGQSRMLVLKRPVGPALFVTPWNYPLSMLTRKMAPALAAGCTSVLKPSEKSPLTALAFAALLEEAGIPAGVVNVVTTTRSQPVISLLLHDERLRKLSFTGSTRVGKALLAEAAGNVLRTSMELGGNAPFLVFDDADVCAAVAGAKQAKLRNMGEACIAANRFIVHAAVADEFVRRMAGEFAAMRVAPGMDAGSEIGPLIDGAAQGKVHSLVTGALKEGAKAVTGGVLPEGPGYFYPPTVLTDVPPSAEILREEIFGPVAPVVTFEDEADAVRIANDTRVGLVSYVYTADMRRVMRLSEQLEAGMIGVNRGVISNPAAPFGGVKQSGLGREGGSEGIEEFLEAVYVALDDPFAE